MTNNEETANLAPNPATASKFLPLLTKGTLDPISDSCLTLARSGDLHVAYAPFDHVAAEARLVVVGITPGLTQAVAALQEARKGLSAGHSHAQVLRNAKLTASFSGGAMRSNLVA